MKHVMLCYASVLLLVLASACSVKEDQKNPVVELGKKITFDYAAGFDNGTLFDTTFEIAAKEAGIYDSGKVYQPVTLVYGKDPLFLGLHEALLGMKVGEVKNIRVSPQKAYGMRLENSTISINQSQISNYENLKIDDIVAVVGPDGNRINAYVKEMGNENVTLDLNHPLAGQFVHFSIILRNIE